MFHFWVNDPFETAPNSAATFMILATFLDIFNMLLKGKLLDFQLFSK